MPINMEDDYELMREFAQSVYLANKHRNHMWIPRCEEKYCYCLKKVITNEDVKNLMEWYDTQSLKDIEKGKREWEEYNRRHEDPELEAKFSKMSAREILGIRELAFEIKLAEEFDRERMRNY